MSTDWTHPDTLKALRQALRRGETQEKLAARYGLSPSAVSRLLCRLELNEPPAGEVQMAEARALMGMASLSATYTYLRGRGIRIRKWGGRRTAREADLAPLLAERSTVEVYREVPAGLYTAAQVAERHHLCPLSLRTRICREKIKPTAYLQTKHRRTALYDLGRLAPLLPTPSAPLVTPAGYLTTAEVAQVTGSSCSAVRSWRNQGAPHIRCSRTGKADAYHPLHLADWIEATRTLEYARRKARSLRRYAAQQQSGRAA